MDNVVPHLTEGLISTCKEIPQDPIEFLSQFLLTKADEIDHKILEERQKAHDAKMASRKSKF